MRAEGVFSHLGEREGWRERERERGWDGEKEREREGAPEATAWGMEVWRAGCEPHCGAGEGGRRGEGRGGGAAERSTGSAATARRLSERGVWMAPVRPPENTGWKDRTAGWMDGWMNDWMEWWMKFNNVWKTRHITSEGEREQYTENSETKSVTEGIRQIVRPKCEAYTRRRTGNVERDEGERRREIIRQEEGERGRR